MSAFPDVEDLKPEDLDLAGGKCGNWTVLGRAADRTDPKTGREFDAWFVQCDCGTAKILSGNDIRSFHSLSCGCKMWMKANPGMKKPAYIAEIARKAWKDSKTVPGPTP